MGRMELRRAIFNIIEFLTQKSISNQAQKLILHYFNESRQDTAYERAIDAIGRYHGETLPMGDNMPPRLQKMFFVLQQEAKAWDDD